MNNVQYRFIPYCDLSKNVSKKPSESEAAHITCFYLVGIPLCSFVSLSFCSSVYLFARSFSVFSEMGRRKEKWH